LPSPRSLTSYRGPCTTSTASWPKTKWPVSTAPVETSRRALMRSLLEVSAPPGAGLRGLRPLEITVVALTDVRPWRHPACRQMQFGEWLRDDLLREQFEPPLRDHDLAILLTKVRAHSVALRGEAAALAFDPVPVEDLKQALQETAAQWTAPDTWAGDERNVVLALSRVWFTAATGAIAAKDVAAAWVLDRIAPPSRGVLARARAAYLGHVEDDLASRPAEVEAFVHTARSAVNDLL
jgi:streptomycin 3"-adenylyltransferase